MHSYDRTYRLREGYVDHWLLAGPQAIAIDDDATPSKQVSREEIVQRFDTLAASVDAPREGESWTTAVGPVTWVYTRSDGDGRLDLADHYSTRTYVCTWAYVQLACPVTRQIILSLTTCGPFDLWVNDVHVHRGLRFTDGIPYQVPCSCALRAGLNNILIRFEQVAIGPCPYTMALRYEGPSRGDIRVVIPSSGPDPVRHQRIERIIDAASVDRDVYVAEEALSVSWPQNLSAQDEVCIRVQKRTGEIFAQTIVQPSGGTSQELLHAYEVPDGHYRVRLMPHPDQYYAGHVRTQRDFEVHTLRHLYTPASDTSLGERVVEVLQDAAQQRQGIYAEIACMALGWWQHVEAKEIRAAIARVNARVDGSPRALLALLRIQYAYVQDEAFPRDLLPLIKDAILRYRYAADDGGASTTNSPTDSMMILYATCQTLAGQIFIDHIFETTAQAGSSLAVTGKQQVLNWLSARSRAGFSEWDAQQAFSDYLLALTHLVDFCADEALVELAKVMIDKLLFTLAVNSFKGVFGSTHGTTSAYHLIDARLEPTSSITYLLWGAGCLNPQIPTAVSLACSQYDIPTLLQTIATDRPEELWARERHLVGDVTLQSDQEEINKVTFKTPDYMLCSVQDYRKGEEGSREHVWQATLGPAAVVFTTHPSCMSQHDAYFANFWRGNRRLPRIGQWRDVLVVIYRIPAEDPLGFTHARFPTNAFDEHILFEHWAFARKGDGYIGLFSDSGLELMTTGPGAHRELRSFAKDNIWLCQMGRAAIDGSFEMFQQKLQDVSIICSGTDLSCTTIRGDMLQFGWHGDLRVNGDPQPLVGFPHYDSPYCVTQLGTNPMTIRAGEWEVNLDFTM